MSSKPLPTTAKKNIETITQVENELHRDRTTAERVGDQIAGFFGSLRFIVAQLVFLGIWIVVNLGVLPNLSPFDAYPFPMLGLVVGVEFILLTTFVLMNQSRQSMRQEHWGHLTLQVCLLTEQEVTKNLQLLNLICERLRLEQPTSEQDVKELTQDIPVDALVEELQKARNGEDG